MTTPHIDKELMEILSQCYPKIHDDDCELDPQQAHDAIKSLMETRETVNQMSIDGELNGKDFEIAELKRRLKEKRENDKYDWLQQDLKMAHYNYQYIKKENTNLKKCIVDLEGKLNG